MIFKNSFRLFSCYKEDKASRSLIGVVTILTTFVVLGVGMLMGFQQALLQTGLFASDTIRIIVGFFIILNISLVVAIMNTLTNLLLVNYMPIIEILRLMGAHNRFITAHFQGQNFINCLKGGVLGLILAGVIIVGLKYFITTPERNLGVNFFLTFQFFYYFLPLPFIVAGFSFLITYLTIRKLLIQIEG